MCIPPDIAGASQIYRFMQQSACLLVWLSVAAFMFAVYHTKGLPEVASDQLCFALVPGESRASHRSDASRCACAHLQTSLQQCTSSSSTVLCIMLHCVIWPCIASSLHYNLKLLIRAWPRAAKHRARSTPVCSKQKDCCTSRGSCFQNWHSKRHGQG